MGPDVGPEPNTTLGGALDTGAAPRKGARDCLNLRLRRVGAPR